MLTFSTNKLVLATLAQNLKVLLPILLASKCRSRYLFERLVTEAIDATEDTYRWESTRDFIFHPDSRSTIVGFEAFKQLAERHCQCDLTPLLDAWAYRK
jgi:hypothetical protein